MYTFNKCKIPAGWDLLRRPTGDLLLNKKTGEWVVYYQCLKLYSRYKPIEPVKDGNAPWAVNNVNAGDYYTLKEATYISK